MLSVLALTMCITRMLYTVHIHSRTSTRLEGPSNVRVALLMSIGECQLSMLVAQALVCRKRFIRQ